MTGVIEFGNAYFVCPADARADMRRCVDEIELLYPDGWWVDPPMLGKGALGEWGWYARREVSA